MRRIVGILTFLPLLALAACGEAATTIPAGSTSTSGTSKSPTATVSNEPAKVGDTIAENGVHVTLVSVKTVQPGEFDSQPAAGNSYFVLHIAITNVSANVVPYNQYDFTVFSGAGASASSAYLSAIPNNSLLSSGELKPNGHVEGDLVVELPTHDHEATLVWRPSFFENNLSRAWNLGL